MVSGRLCVYMVPCFRLWRCFPHLISGGARPGERIQPHLRVPTLTGKAMTDPLRKDELGEKRHLGGARPTCNPDNWLFGCANHPDRKRWVLWRGAVRVFVFLCRFCVFCSVWF